MNGAAAQVVWVVHCADGKRRHDAAYVRKTKAQEYLRTFNRAGMLADLRCGPHALVPYAAPVRPR